LHAQKVFVIMRLAVLTSSYPLAEQDYRGGFVRDLEISLRSQGIETIVLAPRPCNPRKGSTSNGSLFLLPESIPLKGHGFYGFGIEENAKKNPFCLLGLPPFLTAFAIEALPIVRQGCDAILAHWVFPMGLVGAIISSMVQKPLLVVAHSFQPFLRAPLVRPLTSFVLSKATRIACVSQSIAKSLIELAPSSATKFDVIPLGIDLVTNRARKLHGKERLRLCFVGRLVRLKGVHVLLQAVEGLEEIELTVVGDGPERPRLEALARWKEVENIRFLGELRRNEARSVMQNAHALVIPSVCTPDGRSEGLPLVLLEAWSCGLPVVASRNGGVAEAVARFGGGIFFESGNNNALRNAIARLRDGDTLEKLSKEASKAATNFSWDKLSIQWARWVMGA
jgi:glycosyltransferase involved in cell wall biosynthesis